MGGTQSLSRYAHGSLSETRQTPGGMIADGMRALPSAIGFVLETVLVVRPIVLLLFAAAMLRAEAPAYRAVTVDRTGRLHVALASGKEVLPPRMRGQTSFGDPVIAPDGRTVGWLVMYPDPTITYYQGAELPFKLVVFRDGRILHTFETDQCFWDWQFQDGGQQVAYSTGPTHGGAAQCVLRDVATGRVIARWLVVRDAEPPRWAQNLRQ